MVQKICTNFQGTKTDFVDKRKQILSKKESDDYDKY